MIQIDMEMPKNCAVCPMRHTCKVSDEWDEFDYYYAGRLEGCPLKEVPSGKWIEHETYTSCSSCGVAYPYKRVKHKYCPKCGAQMVEEQQGEE